MPTVTSDTLTLAEAARTFTPALSVPEWRALIAIAGLGEYTLDRLPRKGRPAFRYRWEDLAKIHGAVMQLRRDLRGTDGGQP